MNASEILGTQLRLLEQKLDAAYIAGLEKMIVIHGIGAGSLREAIHDLLRQTTFVKHFSNHWMPSYGWGATEIAFNNGAQT